MLDGGIPGPLLNPLACGCPERKKKKGGASEECSRLAIREIAKTAEEREKKYGSSVTGGPYQFVTTTGRGRRGMTASQRGMSTEKGKKKGYTSFCSCVEKEKMSGVS